MTGEWKLVSLDQIYEFSSGLSKPRSEFGEGYPFLSFKDHNTFVPRTLTERVRSSESERQRLSIRRGDVFLTRTSETVDELGMSCVALADIPNATFNGFTKRLRPRSPDIVVPEYAGYFFRSSSFRNAVYAMSSLSTRASLNEEMLARLSMWVPPASVQVAIGRILKSLDDKIELNRRMKETLEAIVLALFNSWFVDFDPVRAKSGGRDPGLPQALAELFPGGFEESQLGKIPAGWQVGRLDDLLILQRGFDLPAASRSDGPYPVIAASGPNGFHDQFMVSGPGVTTGRSGVLGKVFFVHGDFWPLNTSLWVKEFKCVTPAYAYFLLSTLDFGVFNAGSAVPTLNRNHVHNLPALVPPAPLVRHFDEVALSLLERQRVTTDDSVTLVALRDALLPKLISGEMRVEDAERFLEECAHEARSPPSSGEGMRLTVA
jgi:type I restriction enzyme S subunit